MVRVAALNQAKLDRIIAEAGFGGLESVAADAAAHVQSIKDNVDALDGKTVDVTVRVTQVDYGQAL